MDVEFWSLFLKIIIFLPFILFLIYLSLKYGGTKLQVLQGGKYIRIVEKISLSKDNSIMVVKIGDKGYVMSSTNNKIEILKELDSEELENAESVEKTNSLPKYENFIELINKFKHKKEE